MDDLDRALARLREAKEAEQAARAEFDDVIRKMIATGPRGTQAEIVRRTGMVRETIRQIANGVSAH